MFLNTSGYSQPTSGVNSSRDYRLEDQVTKIDNGGLFNKERCKKIAKYS